MLNVISIRYDVLRYVLRSRYQMDIVKGRQ